MTEGDVPTREAERTTALTALGSSPPLQVMLSRIGPVDFTLAAAGRTVRLRDEAFRVLAPTERERYDACEAERPNADISVAEWQQIATKIAEEADPAARLAALMGYKDRALKKRYAAMIERWQTDRRFSAGDVRPPLPSTVLRHLRVNDTGGEPDFIGQGFAVGEQDVWCRAAKVLVQDEGLDVAFERLGTLPVPLPDVLRQALLDSDAEQRRIFVKHAVRAATSPVRVLHVLRVLSWLSATDRRYLRLARRVARSLLSQDFQRKVVLLRDLVAEAYASALANERDIAPDVARGDTTNDAGADRPASSDEWLLSSWCHASWFFDALDTVGVNLSAAVRWVEHRAGQRTSALFSPAHLEVQDSAHPALLRYSRFVVGGLQYVTHGSELIDSLEDVLLVTRAQFMNRDADGAYPQVDLVRDLRAHPNRLGSWVQPSRREDGTIAVGETVFVSHNDAPERLREAALAGLERSASDLASWATLHVVDGQDPLGHNYAKRLCNVVEMCDLPTVLIALDGGARMATIRLAQEAGRPGREELRAQLRRAFTAVAARSAEAPAGRALVPSDDLSALQSALIEGLYVLAQAEPSSEKAIASFVQDLTALSDIDPIYLQSMHTTLETLVLERPLTDTAQPVTLLLKARAL